MAVDHLRHVREYVTGQEGYQESIAIRLLSEAYRDLERHNTVLQAHNTELLLRARAAEAQRFPVDEATSVLLTGEK